MSEEVKPSIVSERLIDFMARGGCIPSVILGLAAVVSLYSLGREQLVKLGWISEAQPSEQSNSPKDESIQPNIQQGDGGADDQGGYHIEAKQLPDGFVEREIEGTETICGTLGIDAQYSYRVFLMLVEAGILTKKPDGFWAIRPGEDPEPRTWGNDPNNFTEPFGTESCMPTGPMQP